jgi:hypothetical protein
MRKLLLGTTALAAAGALITNAAIADVSISGNYEWRYNSRSSQQTALDGTTFDNESEVTMSFTNKTDSGLTVGMVTEFETDDGDSAINEASISIAGGFGKVILGGNDAAGEYYGIGSSDIIGEDTRPSVSSASIGTSDDIIAADGDENKIMYHLPAMGGLTAGISFTDSGETTGTDTTSYGARYTMDAGGNAITIAAATATKENATAGAADTDSQNLAVKVVSGDMTFVVAQGGIESAADDHQTTGAAVSYKMANGMVLGAYTMKSEDDKDTNEEYTASGVEVQYTIAAGLKAFINVDDYEYTAATTGGQTSTNDSGTNSKLTIQAKF